MRRSLYFCCLSLCGLILLALLLQQGVSSSATRNNAAFPAQQQLAKTLGLTDLAIWSEARYTRHPSQADLFTAFQNHPGAFDHFPAGSIIGPGSPQRKTTLRVQKQGQP